MFMSATATTRLATPSHKPWAYTTGQGQAANFLTQANSALLVADPGAGKTAIVLSALVELQARSSVRLRVLVIAPLRVCQLVWRQEGMKWSEFRHLKFVLLHGPKKESLFDSDADVFLINPEGVDWLCELYFGRSLPFEILCIDECFVAGTPVAAPCGERAIETLRVGDLVTTDVGSKPIVRVSGRPAHVITVELEDGRQITCTPEHPFFTDAGWVSARNLQGRTLASEASVSFLRYSVPDAGYYSSLSGDGGREAMLLEILQSEENVGGAPGTKGASCEADDRGSSLRVEQRDSVLGRKPGQDVGGTESERGDLYIARWEWPRDGASRGCTGPAATRRLHLELPDSVGGKARRLSYLLQSRLWPSESENRGRGGRGFSQQPEPPRAGPQEGRQVAPTRVARVSYQERDSLETVYNIEVQDCPRYFAGGVLVHNCTKFKNPKANRSKRLRKRLKSVQRRWGLTGSLVPNGYMDLFGQMLMLDDGAALGRYITQYREAYFVKSYDGFNYDLRTGAGKQIEERIHPYCFRLPYTELPPLSDDLRYVELSKEERKVYTRMKNDMLVQLGTSTITAANSGAVYSKLKQMANGAVYKDGSKAWEHLHDRKIEALAELIEELQGQPLLIGYEFRHDLERIQKAFPSIVSFDGANEKQAIQIESDWNANKLQLLAAHPASIGHGLNLQQGAASHIAWFSATIDYELYDQFIRRLRRRGNDAARVVNHIFLTRGTVDDELTLPAIQDKGLTQSGLLFRLAKAMGSPPAGDSADYANGVVDMTMKLGRQPTAGAPTPAVRQTTAPAPSGKIIPGAWGKKVAAAPVAEAEAPRPAGNPFGRRQTSQPSEVVEQKQEIERRISQRPEDRGEQDEQTPAREIAAQTFSESVKRQLTAPKGEADAMAAEVDAAADAANGVAPAPRTRRRKADTTEPVNVYVASPEELEAKQQAANTWMADQAAQRETQLRAAALAAVFEFVKAVGTPDEGLGPDDVVGVAETFLTFLRG